MNLANYLLTLLLVCTSLFTYGRPSIDSLKQAIRENPEQFSLRLDLCTQLWESYDTDSMGYHAQYALELATEQNDARGQAFAHYQLGKFYSEKEYVESETHYREAIRLAERIEANTLLANVYRYLSILLREKGQFAEAEEQALQSIHYADLVHKEENSPKSYVRTGIVRMSAGTLFSKMDRNDKAMQMAQEVIRIAEEGNDSSLLSNGYSLLAMVHTKLDQHPQALAMHLRSLEIAKALGNQHFVLSQYNNVGMAYNHIGQSDSAMLYLRIPVEMARRQKDPKKLSMRLTNLAFSLYNLGEIEQAIQSYREMIALSRQHSFLYQLCKGYRNLSYLYLEKGALNLSETYADSAIALGDSIGSLAQVAAAYENKYLAAKQKGNFEQALAFFEQKELKEDSLNQKEHLANLDALAARFQNKEKMRDISSLRREAEIASLKIQRKNILLYGMVGMLIVLSLLGYVWVKQRFLAHQQKLMAAEQRLFRAQINPHFFFNVLSHIQSHLLTKKDLQASAVLLSRFAKLMREVLDSSAEDEVSLADEVDSLRNYLELQKLRMPQAFEYEIEVEDSLTPEETFLPPMLAQPFVENALEHGLAHSEGKGKLSIQFQKRGDALQLFIRDNGIGLEQSRSLQKESQGHVSRALQITRDRLYLLKRKTHKEIEFKIENALDAQGRVNGTIVQMLLPMMA